jgi:hypothetical protein
MLGFTRIDLSFFENLRSVWVVVIGLGLLSLAWTGLDLGSGYVTSFIPMLPYHCLSLWLLILLVENRTWGDSIGIVSV